MMRPLRNLRRHQDANALIEVALIFPVMILMILAVLDFAIILDQDLRVADSARSAAEGATIRAYATNTGLMQAVGNLSTSSIPNYKIVATTYCTCANGVVGSASCASHTSCGSYGIPNQYIQITATATLPLLFGVAGLPVNYKVKTVAIARTAWTGTM